MKGFDVYLSRSIREEWSPYYVDYEKLKLRLKVYSKRRKTLRNLIRGESVELTEQDVSLVVGSEDGEYFRYLDETDEQQQSIVKPREALQRLSNLERSDFCQLLETEISKAATFYGTLLEQLAKSATNLQKTDTESVGNEILEVTCFVVVNVITLGQILIRYDGFVRTCDGAPLSEWYLQQRIWDTQAENDHSHGLFDRDALNELQTSFCLQAMATGESSYVLEFTKQYRSFRDLLDKTFDSVERAAGRHIVFRDRFISTLRHYFLVGSVRSGLSLEPKFLRMKGRHLKEEMRQVARWRQTREVPSEEDESRKLDPENVLPLALNLVSCFLFMMNNYIIEPSSAYYANALGSSDALSGLMIGMAPWFALLSAIAYSIWTNRCYKHPILFAGGLMLIGNMMYASAYTYQSIEVCLLGRAITGLGAPRVINRRYVADATPFGLRTAASAAFAMATALGAALGPGMAIVLDMISFEFHLPLLGKQYFNGMTGPGYFMAAAWTLYTLCIILTFKEPNRSGLDELRKREALAASSSNTALMETTADHDFKQGNDDELSVDSFDEDASVSLFDSESGEVENTSSPLYCFKHITHAVVVCMSLLFMKRVALESIVGSTSIVTKNRYGWSIKNVGTLHLVNGIIVIPVTIAAGWLSQFYEDRYLATWLIVVTLFGMSFLVDFTDLVSHNNDGYNDEAHWLVSVGPIKYITGSLIAFSGIEACESYVASLMSKVVPSALAVGTFNSGLLATLVGTSGRATGDVFITAMALISVRNVLNLLILPGMLLMVISLFLIRRNYDILAV